MEKEGKKKRWTVWDIVAWLVIAFVALWLVLKVLGIINTPLFVQYSPLFGAVYLAGYMVHKLKSTTEDVRDIKNEVAVLIEEVRGMDKDLSRMDKDISIIKEKVK